MADREKLFILEKKEALILVGLVAVVAAFSFTLGVHLGKKINPPSIGASTPGEPGTQRLDPLPDELPTRQEFAEQSKGTSVALDESLTQNLHDEVGKTGIKIDVARQVELPTKSKSKTAAAQNSASAAREALARLSDEEREEGLKFDMIAAAKRPEPDGRFTLELGNFNTLQAAKDKLDAYEALGMSPLLRKAGPKQNEFKIFLGGYDSTQDAEKAGERFKTLHMIESYQIARRGSVSQESAPSLVGEEPKTSPSKGSKSNKTKDIE